ncbi:MAG: hypothetical protein GY778_19715, partial [bacterium]|nr:hypothetical protein [bacterium]
YVQGVDALRAGRLCVRMGGGRQRAEDPIDPRVGLVLHHKRGDRITAGEPLFTLFLPENAAPDTALEGENELVEIAATAPAPVSAITALVTPRGVFDDPGDISIREHCPPA